MVDDGGRGASLARWWQGVSQGRWWRRPSPRGWIVLSVLALLVAVRVSLPPILERVLVSQGNEYLDGTVEVGNVDLWLLAGGIAVDDVALRPTSSVPGEETLVTWKRLYVQLGWWPLVRRVARIEDFELDGLRVNVARLRDGRLVLPELRPQPEADEPVASTGAGVPEESSADAEPFAVQIDRAALLDASIRVRDDVPGTPTYREIELPEIEVTDLALATPDSSTPGHVDIRAGLRDGVIHVVSSVRQADGGFDTDTRIDITDLPLDQLHVHVPALGWHHSQGRLNGSLRLTVDPEIRMHASGELSLADLRIDVPHEDEPALAWRRLEIEIDDVDVAKDRVSLGLVSLDGARILLRPQEPSLLPVIAASHAGEPAPPAAAGSGGVSGGAPAESPDVDWQIAVASVSVTDARSDVALAEGPATLRIGRLALSAIEANAGGAWKLGPIELADASAGIELATGPARLDVATLSASDLESTPGSTAKIAATFAEQDAHGELTADLTLEPLAARARIDLEDVSLGRYATLSGVSPVDLPSGLLQAALTLDYVPARAELAGQIRVHDLQVATPDGKAEFAAGWESLDVDIRALEAPLDPDDPAPLSLELAEATLARPWIRLTETADGLVLPVAVRANAGARETVHTADHSPDTAAAQGDTAEPASDAAAAQVDTSENAPEATAAADQASGTAGARPLRVRADRVRIEDGSLAVTDRAVKPVYRGKVEHLSVDAKAIEFPENTFEELTIRLNAPGGAPISVDARSEGGTVRAEVGVDGLALAQFNPFVQAATGYTILGGTASLATDASWGEDRYRADSDLALHDLDVGNATGGTLFKDQFGISLAAALALMRDVTGKIALSIPVEGSRAGGAEVELVPIVTEALARAIVGAIMSPLKLLGAVTMVGGKVADITPSPVAFRPGTTDVAAEAAGQVESIGNVLAASPQVRLELAGTTSAADVRALQEAAVLADFQDEGGFLGGLRNLASGGARGAVRKALEERAQGGAGVLDTEDAALLDELVAEKSISDEELAGLANARAASLRQTLVEEDGVPAEQLAIGEPRAARDDGPSEVEISLVAR